jgi:hypothetical protein
LRILFGKAALQAVDLPLKLQTQRLNLFLDRGSRWRFGFPVAACFLAGGVGSLA